MRECAFMRSLIRSLVRLSNCVGVYVCIHVGLHSRIPSRTYSFSKSSLFNGQYLLKHQCLLGFYWVPGPVLAAGNLLVNPMGGFLCSWSSESGTKTIRQS